MTECPHVPAVPTSQPWRRRPTNCHNDGSFTPTEPAATHTLPQSDPKSKFSWKSLLVKLMVCLLLLRRSAALWFRRGERTWKWFSMGLVAADDNEYSYTLIRVCCFFLILMTCMESSAASCQRPLYCNRSFSCPFTSFFSSWSKQKGTSIASEAIIRCWRVWGVFANIPVSAKMKGIGTKIWNLIKNQISLNVYSFTEDACSSWKTHFTWSFLVLITRTSDPVSSARSRE